MFFLPEIKLLIRLELKFKIETDLHHVFCCEIIWITMQNVISYVIEQP